MPPSSVIATQVQRGTTQQMGYGGTKQSVAQNHAADVIQEAFMILEPEGVTRDPQMTSLSEGHMRTDQEQGSS